MKKFTGRQLFSTFWKGAELMLKVYDHEASTREVWEQFAARLNAGIMGPPQPIIIDANRVEEIKAYMTTSGGITTIDPASSNGGTSALDVENAGSSPAAGAIDAERATHHASCAYRHGGEGCTC